MRVIFMREPNGVRHVSQTELDTQLSSRTIHNTNKYNSQDRKKSGCIGSGEAAANGRCIIGIGIGMPMAVAMGNWRGCSGCGAAGTAGFVRGLCFLSSFGGELTASPASFKAFM